MQTCTLQNVSHVTFSYHITYQINKKPSLHKPYIVNYYNICKTSTSFKLHARIIKSDICENFTLTSVLSSPSGSL